MTLHDVVLGNDVSADLVDADGRVSKAAFCPVHETELDLGGESPCHVVRGVPELERWICWMLNLRALQLTARFLRVCVFWATFYRLINATKVSVLLTRDAII